MPTMDYSRLLGRLRECGLTQKELAEIIGISEGQMSQKIQGNYPFKQSEIGSVCDTLGINQTDIGLYFLPQKLRNRNSSANKSSAHMTEPPPGREAVCDERKVVREMSKTELRKTAIGAIIGAILAQIICHLLFDGFAQTGYQIIVCFVVGIPCGYLGRKFLYADYLSYVNGPTWKRTAFGQFLADEIQTFIETDTGHAYDILIIESPPQHGKSVTVTEALPSWYLGKYKRKRVIEVSYNDETGERFCRTNKNKVKKCGSTLFGIKVGSIDRSDHFELTDGGSMISRGIMSGITGNPADLLIIDDPVKSRQEADSETTRNRLPLPIQTESLAIIRSRQTLTVFLSQPAETN